MCDFRDYIFNFDILTNSADRGENSSNGKICVASHHKVFCLSTSGFRSFSEYAFFVFDSLTGGVNVLWCSVHKSDAFFGLKTI